MLSHNGNTSPLWATMGTPVLKSLDRGSNIWKKATTLEIIHTIHNKRRGLLHKLIGVAVCPAPVSVGVVLGDVAKGERTGDVVEAQLEVRDVRGNRAIPGVQPLQVRVQVARRTAREGNVFPLDGLLRLDGHVLTKI